MHKTSARHLLFSILKWVLSGGMLAYALHAIDVEQIRHMLTHQNPLVPVVVTALMIFQMAISTFRWQRLLRLLSGYTAPYRQLFNLNFISVFFNSCLPGTIGGDVVRAMLLKGEKYPLTLCAHSVIIDRLLAVLAVFLMVAVSLPWLGRLLPALPVAPLLGLCAAMVPAGLWLLAKAPRLLARLPSTHFLRMISHLLESVRRTVFAPRDFAILMAQAIAAHACFCLGVYLLGISIGADFTFGDCLLLIPPVLLLMMLPISIGGWGIREVSMVGFLALAGVPKEAALTISVQFGILAIVASLPGAWCYIRQRKPAAPENDARQS